MELEDLKDKWQKLNVRVEHLERDNKRLAAQLATGRALNAQKTLANMYMRIGTVGLVLPCLAPALVEVLNFDQWVACLYGIFGIVMMALDYSFAGYIRQNDYMTLPVVEALRSVIAVRKRQTMLRIFGITMGVIVIASMFGQVLGQNNSEVMYGMLIGLCLGTPVGVFMAYRSIKLVRTMQSELQRCLDEDDSDER
ncbi:MAG: hypothetical protein J1F05_00120 [Muribaculaceae bacterium]|nr:hypothetical protein [Muribaculaceae bacterium]